MTLSSTSHFGASSIRWTVSWQTDVQSRFSRGEKDVEGSTIDGVPSLDQNRKIWLETYDWSQRGEEWSKPWGTSAGQWVSSIWPRIAPCFPADRILELAPGFGRWTKFLVPLCREYVGVDLSPKCVEACAIEFPDSKFFLNDGLSLSMLQGNFDLIFSFDSLVHAEIDVFESYIPQIIGLLSPVGVAFIHHANTEAKNTKPGGYRANSVCNGDVSKLVELSGGRVICQEAVSTNGNFRGDGITCFSRADVPNRAMETSVDCEDALQLEARLAREVYSKYAAGIESLGRRQRRNPI